MQLTVREVSKFLNVSESMTTRWIKQRGLPAQHVAGQYRFNRTELLEWATLRKMDVSPDLFQDATGNEPVQPRLDEALQAGGILHGVQGADKETVLRTVVESMPLPLKARARSFVEGIKVMVPSHRRTPPESLTPRAKTHNYLNLIVASQEVEAVDPSAWAILLDTNGNLCEGLGSNIFIVKDGEIFTPREKFVLPGVSRQTAIDLALGLGYTVTEADLDLYDAYNADEVFITSTSLCICPASSVNGVHVGPDGQVWGKVTKAIADAYVAFVKHDFVGQYLKFFDADSAARPF